MWTIAQRGGCPAEYKWRPVFNAKPDEICRGAPNSRTDLSR